MEKIQILLHTFGPRWSEYLLVLLASWIIAGAWVGSGNPADQQHSRAVSNTDTTYKPSHVDELTLQQADLFGKRVEQVQHKAAPVVAAPVKASKLNIKLIGTVVAGARSAAVLTRNGSKEQEVFFTGDDIQPNVKLLSVEANAIVISNQGQQERISLEEGKAIAVAPNVARSIPRVRARPSHINRSIDRGHMQKQLRNFSQLLSQARVTPHFTNKKADGFTISNIVKGSLYEQIGLTNGDIIRKVNGESVVSAEQAMRMYKELQNATNIDVEIERNGSIQQVSYSIQ